jgi:hypothetical protein
MLRHAGTSVNITLDPVCLTGTYRGAPAAQSAVGILLAPLWRPYVELTSAEPAVPARATSAAGAIALERLARNLSRQGSKSS